MLSGVYPEPVYILRENVPKFIARTLQRWSENGETTTVWIKPGSPWQNGFTKSVKSQFSDELLNTKLFVTVSEAKGLADRWRWEKDTIRMHSALQGRSPLDADQTVTGRNHTLL